MEETINGQEVLHSTEVELDLRTAFDMDPADGAKHFSRGAAIKRAENAEIPNDVLLEQLRLLPSGSEISVIPMINRDTRPPQISFDLRITCPEESE